MLMVLLQASERSLVPTPKEAADQAKADVAAMQQKLLDLGVDPMTSGVRLIT
jgi:hypothetical protein